MKLRKSLQLLQQLLLHAHVLSMVLLLIVLLLERPAPSLALQQRSGSSRLPCCFLMPPVPLTGALTARAVSCGASTRVIYPLGTPALFLLPLCRPPDQPSLSCAAMVQREGERRRPIRTSDDGSISGSSQSQEHFTHGSATSASGNRGREMQPQAGRHKGLASSGSVVRRRRGSPHQTLLPSPKAWQASMHHPYNTQDGPATTQLEPSVSFPAPLDLQQQRKPIRLPPSWEQPRGIPQERPLAVSPNPQTSRPQQQPQEVQPSPLQQQPSEKRRQSGLQECLALVAWLRDSQLPLEGSVISKSETAVVVQLMLPAAVHHLLPKHIRIPRQLFTRVSPGNLGPPKDLNSPEVSGEVMDAHEGPLALDTGEPPQVGDMWRRTQPGDTIKVRVLGVQQQQQQQQLYRGAGNPSNAAPLPSSPSLLELIVQPILEDSSLCTRLPPEIAFAGAAAAKVTARAAAQQPGAGEAELLERLSQQRVSRWLHYLSPPTATWVVPACIRGEDPVDPALRRPVPAQRLRAPPSTRPLRCRIAGLLRKREAAVVEVLEADDEWHPAVSGVGAAEGRSPTVTSIQAEYSVASEQAGEIMEELRRNEVSAAEEAEGSTQVPSAQSERKGCHSYGHAHPYQRAERAIRLEQQTARDALRQEELLVQQNALLRKMLPHEHEAQLRALQRLCQQHPQLHAYQNHLHNCLEAPQEAAVGALGLLPLRELAAFMKIRKGWSVEEPLRLYFSSVEGSGAPSRRHSGRRGHSGGRNEPSESELGTAPEDATLWFSIYPAVPLEVAHLLLHDMPVPLLASHFRMFEQRQMAEQQEEHQQLLNQIQRHHEELARERTLRRERQQREAGDGETSTQLSTVGAANPERQTSTTSRHPAKSEGSDSAGRQKPGQFPLRRIPVKPPWWASGDWLYREARLSHLLGPFFYRQLVRLRVQEQQAESSDTKHEHILDPRGEQFEDITSWVLNPEQRRQLTPSFVRKYTNSLRTALQVLTPRAYPTAFRRFLAVTDGPDDAIVSQIKGADITQEIRSLLEEFVSLRRVIIAGLARYSTPVGDMHVQGSQDSGRMTSRWWEGEESSAHSVAWPMAGSSASPLRQLLQLHSRLRLQLRPQQQAPSLDEWRQQQHHREMQRRSQRKTQAQLEVPAEDETMEAPEDMPRMQLHPWDEDEHDAADKVADEVELQLLEYSQGEPEHAHSAGVHLPYTKAYQSGAIRKPRSFYNYFGEDVVPLLKTINDEGLMQLAGGPGAFTTHELFVPLPGQHQQSTASPLIPPGPSAG